MLVLFAILALGALIGKIRIGGTSFGSAGVLFAALVFGHYKLMVPKEIMDLGLLLFVYSVGLQAGPRFFRTFRSKGIQFITIALVIMLAGAAMTVAVACLFRLPHDIAAGLFTGALTCTPALAGAIEIVRLTGVGEVGELSVGYGVAYPFSMTFVVLVVSFLPVLLRRNVKEEERRWLDEVEAEVPRLQARRFRITNRELEGTLLKDVKPGQVNISRVYRNGRDQAAVPDMMMRVGDVVTVVGPESEMDKVAEHLGEVAVVPVDYGTNVVTAEIDITERAIAGKQLRELQVWHRFGVVITRLRRQEVEIAPTGGIALEPGDTVKVVGEYSAVDEFTRFVSAGKKKVNETTMTPYLIGLVIGILIGSIPLHLPNGMTLKLGLAGGVFITSLFIGHFGGIGPLTMHVPAAARNLSRELGLMLFLAGAGTVAGSRIVGVIQEHGMSMLVAGMLITTVSVMVGIAVMHLGYRMNVLSIMGALCAGMTNPPGLSAASRKTETDLPMLAYASVYPMALIFKILCAQFLIEILRALLPGK